MNCIPSTIDENAGCITSTIENTEENARCVSF